MTIAELELESFRQIRQKISLFTDNSSNDEIAGYVKGVVNLERELYKKLEKEGNSSVVIEAIYGFHGSQNDKLIFDTNKKGEVELLTDFGERIATITNLMELKSVVDKLVENKYATDET